MKRPRILTNFAITADGKVSTRNQTPSGFTSARDKRRLLEIRSLADALFVGRGTAEADNMSMTMPVADLRAERTGRGQSEHPLRVLLTNSGNISTDLKVFQNTLASTIVATTEAMPEKTRQALQGHADLLIYPEEKVPLGKLLEDLRSHHGIKKAVCEGGPTLLRALLADDLVDEMFLTIAPKIFGGRDAPTLTGLSSEFLPAARDFRLRDFFIENNEAYCHYVRV